MIESIISGAVQGIAEWLPISSEGVLVLLKTSVFKSDLGLVDLIGFALFLHLGTFLAALIYFRKEIISLFNYKEKKESVNFYILATIVSGIVGFFLLKAMQGIEKDIGFTGKGISILIGLALLITGFLQFKKKAGLKQEKDLKLADGFILGILQGFSIIPGLSRSGLTVSGLLLRKFNDTTALKLSFITSLPVVLGANIALNLDRFSLSLENFIGLLFSFIFGILTIHILLKVSQKINFAWFVLIFGLITILSVII